jgi:hypothetical protein
MALINQKTGYGQGSANARLYGLASRQASTSTPAYFHLITSGNNSVPGQNGFAASLSAPHYNPASGLGSIDGNVLVNHWTDLLPATSTALTATPNPASIGQNVTLTATVTGAAAKGTVQFIDGTTNLGLPVSMTGGVATLVTSALASGSHSMTASYSGDVNSGASTSAAVLETVNKAISTVSVATSAPSITVGQSVTFTATVSGVSPTGTVQFTDGGVDLGAAVALSGATATLTTATLTAGSHLIAAIYAGDASNLVSASATVTQTVNGVAVVADAGDVPTLPQWAALCLGILLMSGVARTARSRGQVGR